MFYERYLYLCNKKRLSPSAAAERSGFNRGTVSAWKKKYEQGSDVRPEPDVIAKICAFFDCSETWLLGIEEQKEKAAANEGDGLSLDKKKLLEFAKQCPDDKAPAMLQAMQIFLQNWSK